MTIIPLIISLLAITTSASALIVPGWKKVNSVSRRDLPHEPSLPLDSNFKITFTIIYIAFALNLFSALFICYHTFRKWCGRGATGLAISYRLPFYTAVFDIMITMTTVINTAYTLVHSRPWPDPFCTIISLSGASSVTSNLFLFTVVALTTYMKVAFRSSHDFGRYDWKLIGSTVFLGLLANVPFQDALGGQAYWCINRPEKRLYIWISLSIYLACMVISTFSYLQILSILRKNRRAMGGGYSSDNAAAVENRVTKKISAYLFVFMFQWFPVITYILAFLIKFNNIWPLIVTTVGANFGGTSNAIAFAYLEGIVGSRKSSSWSAGGETQSTKVPSQEIRMTVVDESHISAQKSSELEDTQYSLPADFYDGPLK